MTSIYGEQLGFAAGTLIGTRTDVTGSTPRKFGVLQDVSVDFSSDVKLLYGQNRWPVAMGMGKGKIEVKAKLAGIRGALFNDLFFGATTAATQILFADAEAGSVPGTSTYTVTVSNSATWLEDKGVFYASTGLPMKLVASGPTIGQYSVAAGIYTFAAADASVAVYISYTYSSTSGIQIPISQTKLGVGPSFKMVLAQAFDGRQGNYILNNCMVPKWSLPTKQDDFTVNELDFAVAADAAGNIGTINLNL